jgi:glycosyltransferase involved in cell wall biosynthesis
MKILQVGHSFPPENSGVGEVIWQLSRHLTMRGHDVHVATSALPGSPTDECMAGIHVHRFAVSGNTLVGIEGDRQGYTAFLQRGQWDVVVFHNVQNWPIELALPLFTQMGAHIVVVSHGTFHLKTNLPLSGGFSGQREKRSMQYFEALRTAMCSVQAFVVLSPELVDDPVLKELGVIEPVVIRNGVEPAKPTDNVEIRSRLGIGDHPWVITVSRHSRIKNHRAFFRIARDLRHKLPGVRTSIVGASYPAASWKLGQFGIAGGCWYECRLRHLQQPYVQLLSDLSRSDVFAAIAASDVVVLTSHHEASPLVLLEAMAASVPWVSVDVGCVRDYTGGLVVDDEAEIADVVSALLCDPDRRAALASSGRKAADTVHSWSVIAAHHESLYTSLCCEVV